MPEQALSRPKSSSPLRSAKGLTGLRVFEGPDGKALGKVRHFVFHPVKKTCVGLMVKRPDAAMMFSRKDVFVSFDGFRVKEDGIHLKDGDDFVGNSACRRLGVDLDVCVIWQGMPVIAECGEGIGFVDDIAFSSETGRVEGIVPQKGATAKVLLGRLDIPRDLIVGFKLGVGDLLATSFGSDADDMELRGAIVVSDKVLSLDGDGGLADKAGKSAAIAAGKAKAVKEAAKPRISSAGKAAGKAVDDGAFALGRQLSRTKGMFAAFKSEYDKAVADDAKRKKR